MILVNLYGGPGVGKSTAAAFIFSQLKMKGVNVVTRNFEYENVGRRHNEEEANDLQDRIYQLLINENVNFLIGESSTVTYDNIVQNVLDAL